METHALDERRRFVRDLMSGSWSVTELCDRYRISRPTAYKWAGRYAALGEAGLMERSRAPHRCPHRTPPELERLILNARQHYGWGAKKLRQILQTKHPVRAWPALSTFNDILDRHDLLQKQRRRRHWAHPGAGAGVQTERPNQIWPADFKGHFRLGNGAYCYPLTITDHFSRQVLLCQGLAEAASAPTRAQFLALFRRVGLPEAIRTDNGAPFASVGIQGLSRLSVWWMQLGIIHQRIRPGRPQENGTHERMHRELKRETARPPAATPKAQQHRFDRFRRRYNEERPHEALGHRTPASLWQPSARAYPERLSPPDYPVSMDVRRVSATGTIRLAHQRPFLSQVLQGHDVGLEEVGDGLWNIVFFRTLLGRLDQRTLTITGT